MTIGILGFIIILESILIAIFMRDDAIQMYKIGYYEQKLKKQKC